MDYLAGNRADKFTPNTQQLGEMNYLTIRVCVREVNNNSE